ncbi:hypothetical protein [Brevundimonas sp.]|uniref:hypothetical protein n=1 Tax=Brevundimonas sp. TaxID=1871086 RepID=UPI0037842137
MTALPILSPGMSEFKASMISGAQPSTELQMRILRAMIAVIPLYLVSRAILLPALYRAMASDSRDRFGFLRLGRDELRVLGVLAILLFISLVLDQAGALLNGLLSMGGLGVLGSAAEAVAMLASIYVSVRLVLQAPASFVTGTIDISGAWRGTRGLFWRLLGLAIMAGVMGIVVTLLLSIVALPFSEAAGGFTEMSPLTTVSGLGLVIVGAVAMTLSMVIVSAPFMAVYRALDGDHSRQG